MAGGLEAVLTRSRLEVEPCCLHPLANPRAVDLGAGFATHAIPLADLGCSVTAIDNNALLLETFRHQIGTRFIKAINDDLIIQTTPRRSRRIDRLHGIHLDASRRSVVRGTTLRGSRGFSGSRWDLHHHISRLLHAANRHGNSASGHTENLGSQATGSFVH